MHAFGFLFLPELGRAFRETGGCARRIGRAAAGMVPTAHPRNLSWRRLLERRHRGRLALALLLIAAGAATAHFWAAPPASAQGTTIDAQIFEENDDETRAILSFLHDLPRDSGSVVLADMLQIFNAGILVLAGVLLVYQVAAGALDTARAGRWGFGGWQIVRVVAAVALMAPLAGGLNGAQHAVLGLTNLGGDFATAVWSPFTTDMLSPTRSIAPGRGPQALRTIIGRALVLEVCLATANGAAGATLVERESIAESVPPRTTVRYAGTRTDLPPEGCGAIVYDGHGTTLIDGFLTWPWEEGVDPPPVDYELARVAAGRVPAAHYHALNTALAGAIRALASDIASRYVPGSPGYGDPLPDADATLRGSGLEAAYTRILGDALAASQRDQDEAMRDLAETYAHESSWLWAATFFHTLAWQNGRFETAAAETPEVRLPTESLTQWSPPAAAAVRNTLAWLAASSWPPVALPEASVAQGTVSTDPMDIMGSLIHHIPIEWSVMASADNPILSLASLGFWLVTGALTAISSLAAIAVVNSATTAIPLIGDTLNVFANVWPILDGFVTLMLTAMLMAGLVLAYLLPAIPFIRFLFGILSWMLAVIEAVLAITVFAAAHITREDSDTLLTRQTRMGWLFLPGLVLRPVLMIFGLVLGYMAFTAIIALLNAVWVPLLQVSHAQAGASPLGFLAMLVIYTIIAWTAANASFKLIDILPSHVLTWIGGAAGIDAGGSEGVGLAAVGAASRAGTAVTPGFMGRMGRGMIRRGSSGSPR